jgi:hypothetical protein
VGGDGDDGGGGDGDDGVRVERLRAGGQEGPAARRQCWATGSTTVAARGARRKGNWRLLAVPESADPAWKGPVKLPQLSGTAVATGRWIAQLVRRALRPDKQRDNRGGMRREATERTAAFCGSWEC